MRNFEPKYTVLCHQDFSLHSYKCFVPITFHLLLSVPRLLSKYLPSILFVFPQPPTAPTVQLYAFLSVFSAVTNDRFFYFSLHIAFSCLFPFLFFACRKYIIFAAEAKTSIRIKEPPLTLRIFETQNSQCMWQIGRDSIPPLSTSHDEI